jgi:hypothetical protein
MLRGDRSATEQLLTRERALLTQLDDTASLIQLHTQLGTAETLRGPMPRPRCTSSTSCASLLRRYTCR